MPGDLFRESARDAQAVDLEENIEDSLQGQATLLKIGHRAEAG
jgi:hypothetical protein